MPSSRLRSFWKCRDAVFFSVTVYLSMCLGEGVVCGVLVPSFLHGGDGIGVLPILFPEGKKAHTTHELSVLKNAVTLCSST